MNLISGDLLPSEIGMYPGDRTAWCQRDWAIHQDWALQSTSMNGAGVSFHQRKILAHPLCQNWSAKPIKILRVDLTRKKDETAGLGLAQQDRYTREIFLILSSFPSIFWDMISCDLSCTSVEKYWRPQRFCISIEADASLWLFAFTDRGTTTSCDNTPLGPVPWSVALTDAVASPPLAGGRTSIPWLWLAL